MCSICWGNEIAGSVSETAPESSPCACRQIWQTCSCASAECCRACAATSHWLKASAMMTRAFLKLFKRMPGLYTDHPEENRCPEALIH